MATSAGYYKQADADYGQAFGNAAALPDLAASSVLIQAVAGAGENVFISKGAPANAEDWLARLTNDSAIRLGVANLSELHVWTDAAAGTEVHYMAS